MEAITTKSNLSLTEQYGQVKAIFNAMPAAEKEEIREFIYSLLSNH